MTKYKSKIGLELIIPIIIIIGGTSVLMAYQRTWMGLALMIILLVFIIHMFVKTYYFVDNNSLVIRCGFFFFKTIKLDTIKEIKETGNPVSAPAVSLDRLVIIYHKYDSVIISPKEKHRFIHQLTQLNPLIKVTLKKNKNPPVSSI